MMISPSSLGGGEKGGKEGWRGGGVSSLTAVDMLYKQHVPR